MRQLFAPLRPDLDNFLFAAVGEETDGMSLSMISALTRLGLDPWDEAGRLSSLGKQEAIEELAQMIEHLPVTMSSAVEARRIAGGLINLLPSRDTARDEGPKKNTTHETKLWLIGIASGLIDLLPSRDTARDAKKNATDQTKLWLIGLILGAAVLVSVIAHGG